jgi:hypothetical protein
MSSSHFDGDAGLIVFAGTESRHTAGGRAVRAHGLGWSDVKGRRGFVFEFGMDLRDSVVGARGGPPVMRECYLVARLIIDIALANLRVQGLGFGPEQVAARWGVH